jgi:hypothetical protein
MTMTVARETPPALWKQRFDVCAAGADLTTPEGRFAFDRRLRHVLARTYPKALRLHYEAFFRRERTRLFLALDAPTASIVEEEFRR